MVTIGTRSKMNRMHANRLMTFLIGGTLAFSIVAAGSFVPSPAKAVDVQIIEPSADRAVVELRKSTGSTGVLRRLQLEIGKSLYVQTDYTVIRVSIGDPDVVDVVVLSPKELQLVPKSVGGTKVSLIDRADTQRVRLSIEPALSFVPEARAPPKGWWPTTAPVGLSLM